MAMRPKTPEPERSPFEQKAIDLVQQKIRDKGLTLQEVSIALGYPRDGLSRRLRGRKRIGLTEIVIVLEEIGVSSRAFFDELTSPRPWEEDAAADLTSAKPVTREDVRRELERLRLELMAMYRSQGKLPPEAPAEREHTESKPKSRKKNPSGAKQTEAKSPPQGKAGAGRPKKRGNSS